MPFYFGLLPNMYSAGLFFCLFVFQSTYKTKQNKTILRCQRLMWRWDEFWVFLGCHLKSCFNSSSLSVFHPTSWIKGYFYFQAYSPKCLDFLNLEATGISNLWHLPQEGRIGNSTGKRLPSETKQIKASIVHLKQYSLTSLDLGTQHSCLGYKALQSMGFSLGLTDIWFLGDKPYFSPKSIVVLVQWHCGLQR